MTESMGLQSSTLTEPAYRTPPRGIKALAALYLVGVVIAAIAYFASGSGTRTSLQSFILPVIAILAAITSAGLWKGAKWAWWLALFYHLWFGICVKIESILVLVLHFPED